MAGTVDITKIKHHPFIVTVGNQVVGPQKEAPGLEPETELHECLIYENGGKEAVAQYLVKNHETITLTTMDVEWAIEQIGALKNGMNLMAVENKKIITFTPVVEGEGTEKTLIFTDCYLQPGLSYVSPLGGEEHTCKLVYKAVPNPSSKALYTYA